MNKTSEAWHEYRAIGGIRQYLLHCPAQEEAPVLLYLHGGPGFAQSNFAYLFSDWWGGLFTVVHWDQRGAGKTLGVNKGTRADSVTPEQVFLDLEEVVQYLKEAYGKNKIAILGHSWGSILGSLYALSNPEDVLLYIGVGQAVDMRRNEKVAYERLKEKILEAGSLGDMQKLDKTGKYQVSLTDSKERRKLMQIRRLQKKYGLVARLDRNLIRSFIRSPQFRWRDVAPLFGKYEKVNAGLQQFLFEFRIAPYGSRYQMPVCIISGENDYQTAMPLAVEYYESIEAPDKRLFVIEGAGHMPMLETPQIFCDVLQQAKGLILT